MKPKKNCSPTASSKCGKDTRAFHVEIIVPFEVDMELKDVDLYHPATGDKKKLLNSHPQCEGTADRMKQAEKLNPEQRPCAC